MLLIEVAHGTFKHLVAHLKAAFNVFGIALVAQIAMATVVFHVLQECGSEVEGLLSACGLQRDIYLAIGADGVDVAFRAVASVYVFEHLVVIYECRVTIVDDYFEAHLRLLPHQ